MKDVFSGLSRISAPSKMEVLKEFYLRNHQQITFVTLKKIFLLSKMPHPLLLTDNIMVDGTTTTGWNTNQNQMKNIYPFNIVFQVLKVVFIKFLRYNHQIFYFLSLLEIHSTLSEKKDFFYKFFF